MNKGDTKNTTNKNIDITGIYSSNHISIIYYPIKTIIENNKVYQIPEWQRKSNKWSDEWKSDLIDSIWRGFYIPPIVLIKNDKGVIYINDGGNRINAIENFIENHIPWIINTNKNKIINAKSIKDDSNITYVYWSKIPSYMKDKNCAILTEDQRDQFNSIPLAITNTSIVMPNDCQRIQFKRIQHSAKLSYVDTMKANSVNDPIYKFVEENLLKYKTKSSYKWLNDVFNEKSDLFYMLSMPIRMYILNNNDKINKLCEPRRTEDRLKDYQDDIEYKVINEEKIRLDVHSKLSKAIDNYHFFVNQDNDDKGKGRIGMSRFLRIGLLYYYMKSDREVIEVRWNKILDTYVGSKCLSIPYINVYEMLNDNTIKIDVCNVDIPINIRNYMQWKGVECTKFLVEHNVKGHSSLNKDGKRTLVGKHIHKYHPDLLEYGKLM